MRALYFESHGGNDVLQLGELPEPQPAPGEVIVQIEAAALNYNDIWARQGLPGMSIPLPHISGSDGAGRIVELGAGVTNWRVGDEVVMYPLQMCQVCDTCRSGNGVMCKQMQVWGFQTGPYIGAYARYARVQAAQCLPKPKSMRWTDAAAITSGITTVWRMLVTRARTLPGEFVLVFGASGGTGALALQLVKALGGVPIAVTSSRRKAEFCVEMGAAHVIRSDEQDVVQEVKRITDRRGVDVVFDHAGYNTWQLGVASLTWGGRLVICGATEGFDARIDLRHLWNKQLSLLGSHAGNISDAVAAWRLVDQGLLRPAVTEVIALDGVGDALERMQTRRTMGKIAVDLSGL